MKKTFVTLLMMVMLSTFGFSQKGGFKPSSTYKPSAAPAYKPSAPSAPTRTYTPPAPVYSQQPVRQTPVAVATPAPSSNGGFFASTNKPATIAASTPQPVVVRQTTNAATPQPQGTVSSKGWTSSSVAPQTQQKAPSLSDTDKAALMRAKEKGTVFETREQAVNTFKQKELQKYPVSGFTEEPAIRPDYIPKQTTINGQTHTIIYHNREYGYYDRGEWRAYQIAQDAAMLNVLLARNNYYDNETYYQIQQQQAPQQYAQPQQRVDSGWSFLKIFGTVVVIVLGVIIVLVASEVIEIYL